MEAKDIQVISHKLSDGSKVYDVRLSSRWNIVEIQCTTEQAAVTLAEEINRAMTGITVLSNA